MPAITRLGLYGGPRTLYGSFSGKSAQPLPTFGITELPQTPVTLALFDSRRSERLDIDINELVTSVQISTAANRGYDELLIGMEPRHMLEMPDVTYGQLPRPIDVAPFRRAELRIGERLVFEGRVMQTNIPATALAIRGYWQTLQGDDWFASTDTTTDSVGEVIKTMLGASMGPVRPGAPGQFVDPLFTHAPSEFDGRTVADALALVTAEGDVLGNSVDWFVWEDRRLWLIPRVPPSLPHYRFDMNPRTVQVIRDPSDMASSVTVEFQAYAEGTATIASGNTSVTVTHGLGVTPDVEDVRVEATNDLGGGSVFYVDNPTATTFRINLVQDESNSGSSTITSGNTSVDVTHGMSRTPDVDEITVVPVNDTTSPIGHWWIDNIGSSTFRINVHSNPSTSGADWGWRIRYESTPAPADPGAGGAEFAWTVDAGIQRTSEATNSNYVGDPRRRKLFAGYMTLEAAERIRDQLIANSHRERYSVRVTLGPDHHLTGPHGEIIEKHVARSGQWAQVADLPMLMIVSTSYDATGRVLELQLGERYPTLEERIRRLAIAEERRGRNIDPATGGALSA